MKLHTHNMTSKVEIYYISYKTPQLFMLKLLIDPIITLEDLNTHYKMVCDLDVSIKINGEKDLFNFFDTLFKRFNSDDNPLTHPILQKMIAKNGLHTSMSVGDIIKFNNDYYCVTGMGFKKVINL